MSSNTKDILIPTRRINRGKGHSYLLDGEQADGITKALSEGFPKPALIGWAANATAGYAVDHWDELAKLGTYQRMATLQKARFADRDLAANRGTQVHDLAVKLAAGQEIDVPQELLGHVDAYLQFTDDWQPQEELIEAVVINRKHRYMGTLDFVGKLRDGKKWLLDWKTTRSGVYPENALQLAAYRNSETYLGPDMQEHPMPQVDRCGVVWLRADGYDLHPVEATPETFRVFLYALEIARWRDLPNEAIVGEAISP